MTVKLGSEGSQNGDKMGRRERKEKKEGGGRGEKSEERGERENMNSTQREHGVSDVRGEVFDWSIEHVG